MWLDPGGNGGDEGWEEPPDLSGYPVFPFFPFLRSHVMAGTHVLALESKGCKNGE